MFAQYIYQHSRYFALIVVCAIAVGYNSLNIIPRQEGEALGAHGGGQADMAELQAQAEKIAAAIEMP